MKLFTYDGGIVRVDPELRVIKEFRDLIAEDKDREKKTATKWLAFIYHMLDYKSPYQTYAEKERKTRVLEAVDLELQQIPAAAGDPRNTLAEDYT
jgi:heat shock protein HspQ